MNKDELINCTDPPTNLFLSLSRHLLFSHLARQRHRHPVKPGRHRALDADVPRADERGAHEPRGPQLQAGDGGGAFGQVAVLCERGGGGGGRLWGVGVSPSLFWWCRCSCPPTPSPGPPLSKKAHSQRHPGLPRQPPVPAPGQRGAVLDVVVDELGGGEERGGGKRRGAVGSRGVGARAPPSAPPMTPRMFGRLHPSPPLPVDIAHRRWRFGGVGKGREGQGDAPTSPRLCIAIPSFPPPRSPSPPPSLTTAYTSPTRDGRFRPPTSTTCAVSRPSSVGIARRGGAGKGG